MIKSYRITRAVLEVTTSKHVLDQIHRQVRLPEPPQGSMTEAQVAGFVKCLVMYAVQAMQILQAKESDKIRKSYPQPQYERVEIRVLSGYQIVGRVNGAQQTFDICGRITSREALTRIYMEEGAYLRKERYW